MKVLVGNINSSWARYIVSGNHKEVEEVIDRAGKRAPAVSKDADLSGHFPAEIIEVLDDNGLTPIYYAC